jgi:MATE family multidrug resistance protein
VVPIEIPIIYALIFGKLGLPAYGIAGIGYGFAITYTLTFIGLTLYFLKSSYYAQFGLFKRLNLHWGYFKELIRLGLPMGFMHVIEVSTFMFATFWIAYFGTALLAAHQIVMQYVNFMMTFSYAMSQTITVRVGHELGRGNPTQIYAAVWVGMVLSVSCMLLVACAFYLLPQFFLSLDINVADNNNAQLVQDSIALLSIAAILLVIEDVRYVGFGALRGLKDTKFSMYAALIAFWLIGTSCAYLFGFYYDWHGTGIWCGLTLGTVVGASMVILRLKVLFRRLQKQTLSVDETNKISNVAPIS